MSAPIGSSDIYNAPRRLSPPAGTLPRGARRVSRPDHSRAHHRRNLVFNPRGCCRHIDIASLGGAHRGDQHHQPANNAIGLGNRIPLRGTRDEWDGLAANLNSMRDRIQEMAEWNRQVSDNIAHDLRTPLTRLRGRLEKACSQEPDLLGYRELVADALGELDEILKTCSSLLRISQIENRDRTAAFGQINLTEIVREVVDLFDPTAEEQKICLQFFGSEPQFVCGDRDLLFDAISNLVDNAIKQGGRRGEVRIAADRRSEGPVLSIADRGPGIPAEERRKVMKRFYRLEGSRNSPGNGLGLSLVAAVADLHDVEIIMADNAPGLSVELHFPAPHARTPSDLDHSRESSASLPLLKRPR